jgi:class 3 adenylate cyclase
MLRRLPQRDGVNLMTARIVKETGRRVKRRVLHPKQTAEYGRPHRRDVTVVFCDLRGFTAFSETAEPRK